MRDETNLIMYDNYSIRQSANYSGTNFSGGVMHSSGEFSGSFDVVLIIYEDGGSDL